jgi:hypothetical protein
MIVVSLLLACIAHAGPPLQMAAIEGLVSDDAAYWFRYGARGTAANQRGGADGSLAGDAVAVRGYGLAIDGAGDYHDMGTTFNGSINGTMTVCGWFYFNGVNYNRLLGMGDAASASFDRGVHVTIDATPRVLVFWRAVKGGSAYNIIKSGAAAGWHHVAFVRYNNGNRLYHNGVYYSSIAAPDMSVPGASRPWTWGAFAVGYSSPGYGRPVLDDIVATTDEMTASEIRAIYEYGKKGHR